MTHRIVIFEDLASLLLEKGSGGWRSRHWHLIGQVGPKGQVLILWPFSQEVLKLRIHIFIVIIMYSMLLLLVRMTSNKLLKLFVRLVAHWSRIFSLLKCTFWTFPNVMSFYNLYFSQSWYWYCNRMQYSSNNIWKILINIWSAYNVTWGEKKCSKCILFRNPYHLQLVHDNIIRDIFNRLFIKSIIISILTQLGHFIPTVDNLKFVG